MKRTTMLALAVILLALTSCTNPMGSTGDSRGRVLEESGYTLMVSYPEDWTLHTTLYVSADGNTTIVEGTTTGGQYTYTASPSNELTMNFAASVYILNADEYMYVGMYQESAEYRDPEDAHSIRIESIDELRYRQ